MSVGQCKTDPVSGVAGDIYNAWTGDVEASLGDAPGGVLGPLWASGSPLRRLFGAHIQAFAQAIVGAVAPGAGALLTESAEAVGFTAVPGKHHRCTPPAMGIVATLPLAAAHAGKVLCVKKVDAGVGAVVVTPTAPDLIDNNLAAYNLAVQGDFLFLVAHATGWDVLGR